jgi:hypothetical protein
VSQKVCYLCSAHFSRFHAFTLSRSRSDAQSKFQLKRTRQNPISNTRDPRHKLQGPGTVVPSQLLQILTRNSLRQHQSIYLLRTKYLHTIAPSHHPAQKKCLFLPQIPSLTYKYDLRSTHPLPQRTPHSPSHIPDHPQFPAKKRSKKEKKSNLPLITFINVDPGRSTSPSSSDDNICINLSAIEH